jgi:hypothetical protein
MAVLAIFNGALFIKKFVFKTDTLKRSTESIPLTVSQPNKDVTPDIKIIYELIVKKMTGMAENSVYKFKAPQGLSFTGKFRPEYKKLCRLCLDQNLYIISTGENTPNPTICIYLLKCPETPQDVINNIGYLGKEHAGLKGFVRYKIGSDMDHNDLYEILQKWDNKETKITAVKRTHDNIVKVYY